MPPIRIELLGKLRFLVGAIPLPSIGTNRLQSLLAYLVLHADTPQSREQLAYLLWPESSEPQARTNLRQLLHHLRRALPVECSLLFADNQTVCWRTGEACSVDVTEFTTAATRAADAHKRGDLNAALQSLDEAARLYQDDLLPDLYDPWLEPMRDQLRQQFADVLSRLSALLGQAGDYSAAIRHATRLVSLDPLRESSYHTLMRLHTQNSDRSSTLRVYHQCMRTLQRELGVSPSQATQDLFTQALKSETTAARVEVPCYRSSFADGRQNQRMESPARLLAPRLARRDSFGTDPGRARNRQVAPGRRAVPILHQFPGKRGRPCLLLCRGRTARLRTHRRMAPRRDNAVHPKAIAQAAAR